MKLSEKFPRTINPMCSGVYKLISRENEIRFSFWNGHRFICSAHTVEQAFNNRFYGPTYVDYIFWQGIQK